MNEFHCFSRKVRVFSQKVKLPGLYLPGLAELCLSAIKILQWPCAANVYASPSRLEAVQTIVTREETYFFKDVH